MCSNCPDRREISLGFSEEKVLEGQHICYLFNDDTERLRVMSKYLESGILDGEELLYLVDAMTPDEMLDSLEELGIDARSEKSSLTMAEATPAYCPHGTFNCEEMLSVVKAFYKQSVRKEGFPGARGTGEMSWCLQEGMADENALMEYEAKLNQLLVKYPYTACCQYDSRLFHGSTIMNVLAVHPVMIVRGQLVQNPYYVEPEIFLKELHLNHQEHSS